MPFCIIFFALTILFLLCFKFSIISKIFLIIFSIFCIFSVFTSSIEIIAGVFINPYLLISFVLFLIYAFSIFSLKENALTILLTFVLGILYYLAIKQNIFLSVDYGITFAFIINILPILLIGSDLRKGVLCSFYLTLSTITFDSLFWAKELEYIDINSKNILNLLCLLASFSIFLSLVKLMFNSITEKLRKKNENKA